MDDELTIAVETLSAVRDRADLNTSDGANGDTDESRDPS